jgi:hypothetical protein
MSQTPSSSRALAWFRMLLWLVPTGIVTSSFIAFFWLDHRMHRLHVDQVWLAVVAPLPLIYGVGVWEGFLWSTASAANCERRNEALIYRPLMFFLVQWLLVPFVLFVFGLCLLWAGRISA